MNFCMCPAVILLATGDRAQGFSSLYWEEALAFGFLMKLPILGRILAKIAALGNEKAGVS